MAEGHPLKLEKMVSMGHELYKRISDRRTMKPFFIVLEPSKWQNRCEKDLEICKKAGYRGLIYPHIEKL